VSRNQPTHSQEMGKHALTHVSRVLRPIQLTSAFTDIDDLTRNSLNAEEWQPPPPPMIEFMPDPRNAWKKDIPKTINKSDKKSNNRSKNKSSAEQDNDNNITTTANTQASYTQDTISDLQNSSYQHKQLLDNHTRQIEALTNTASNTQQNQQLINEHTVRLDTIDSSHRTYNQRLESIDDYVREHLSTMSNTIANLEEEQQIQQHQQEQMTNDIASSAEQLPTIVENMEKQQHQLLKYFRRQNKINAQTNNELNKLRSIQATHQEMITTLQALVLSLQNHNPSTPQSQQRIRKRIKSRPTTDISIREDSDMESEEEHDELHQIHAITTLQDNSINQLSFIHQPSMDVSAIEDDLLPWDDFSTNTEGSAPNLSLDTQLQDSHHNESGQSNPGGDT
jgi:hypothetical protein